MPRPYATRPFDLDHLPPGIPFIVGNEAAERFSYYGMKAILTVYMTQHLVSSAGLPATLNEEYAKGIYHLFSAATYVFPLFGALLSDIVWGKYRTILHLSGWYCLGHAAIALGDTALGRTLMEPQSWLYLGLVLIAVGAGGVKPCVSAHVGDQFGVRNHHLLDRAFSWFYFAINVGATVSFLLTPWLLEKRGPAVAFGVPGVVMGLALLVFWLGRHHFVHVPPAGWRRFREETLGTEGLRALGQLALLYVLVAPFWALFDQTASSWVLQLERMDRRLFGVEWLSSQLGVANSLLVLAFVPAFTYGVYPWLGRYVAVTPLRRIAVGLFLTVLSFVIVALVQGRIDVGERPTMLWQILAYAVLTAAEVLVSITVLELSYAHAPRRMKSLIMGAYFSSVALGNALTAVVNFANVRADGTVRFPGAAYFWLFAGVMLIAGLLFVPVARAYRGKAYLQTDE